MITANVYVMDVITGKDKWITLPCDDIDSELSEMDKEEVIIVDSENTPFDVGNDVFKANETLKACASFGIDDPGMLEAICMVCGYSAIDDEDLTGTLNAGEITVDAVRQNWPAFSADEKAACYLATEKYIPFGDLKDSDLILVEDKLVDFLDWNAIWDDYMSKGYSCAEVDGITYIVLV